MIPALESVIKYGGQLGVREIVFGMAHRGRLNVLANVMAKPFRVIFHEFGGGSANPEDVGGSGDVKYHLGTSTDREFDGIKVHMSLVANPSHLEAEDPVVLGKVRAIQTINDDLTDHTGALPVLIHGDAAFAGQGIVWECLGFSGIRGYNTGGCIHFVINNQIGFTTSPQFARSSPYPSDVAKGVQAPIFHVNGDDPEAVTFACKLAIEFRQTLPPRHRHRHVVLSPLRPQRGRRAELHPAADVRPRSAQHPPVSEVYGQQLIEQRRGRSGMDRRQCEAVHHLLEGEFDAGASLQAQQGRLVRRPLVGPRTRRPIRRPRAATSRPGSSPSCSTALGRTLTTVPEGLTIHKTLGRVIDAKREMFKSGANFDWATGEALAFGSLLSEGYGVRLSGQDSGRGTFRQRHAVWVDQTDEHKYIPLADGRARPLRGARSARSANMACSASNMAMRWPIPKTLVMWEAQFGDFANGAQIMIDQFIAVGRGQVAACQRPRDAAAARL